MSGRPMDFNRYMSAPEFREVADLFRAEGESVSFGRDDCFSPSGCRYPAYGLVERGAFRYCCFSEEGQPHVVGYAFAGELVGDYAALCCAAESRVRIEALCDSEVLRLSGERLEAFFRADARSERLGRMVTGHLFAEVYERLLQSYVSTPQERYEAILRRCPDLLDRVPLKELASYLRVRPETLSRIRRRVR